MVDETTENPGAIRNSSPLENLDSTAAPVIACITVAAIRKKAGQSMKIQEV
jgi:hypothetical protein